MTLLPWILTKRHKKASEEVEKTLFSGGNAVNAHVWAENFRDQDGAVGLLKILDNCNPGAPHGESRTVERVHEVALAATFWFEANARAARLKSFTIGTRRDFAKFIARGKPNLDVVGFRRGEAHVASAKQNGAMVQPQLLQNGFGVFCQGFVFVVASFRVRELEELDLLELMLAEDAAGVFSGCSGFRTEASRPSGDVNGQLFLGNGLVAIKIVELNLGGGCEPKVRAFELEKIGGEFRQLARAGE